ncbi:hypothetical protein TREMEDRAFT_41188 [Tremella mesenterica DSM 1558]|uniref:uncharacterized protein n=1 Tax=Tremella mesenterica (strain ATCC 24925 / CBS 8224 / DSM 1558 / NBRC 9311 / NRRL Y-6157 / RJB 2259-6 / UBC 559-6) TaxID=578456 RepID=UPI00032C2CFF|nr:uncharacterized protein TREMEDRAFT_41188 [Tremella mesenterica DSM 1558]EIW66002.1 hypothetical protein TREMEDRAFT_41188 [Tremella mesenterica DSM 1558]
MASPYQLAFSLHGHSSDVRCIHAPSPGVPLLLSGSRDGSAILWGPSASGKEWDVKLRVEAPEQKYVSCVGMVKYQGEAFLLVGSSSGILSTYILPSATTPPPPGDALPEPYHLLIEHKQNLCSMDTSPGGLIATGSWDQTAVVWKDFKKVVKIENHTQSVWSIKFVGEDRLLTGAADKSIILHSIDVTNGTSFPLQTFTGHTAPVRGLSISPGGKGFWSCANDSLVNFYTFDRPAPVRSLSGHTSFVYSVSALPGGGAISAGEDGTLRVWSDTELVQTIAHPCNSLWSCAVVSGPTGDVYIASAANDTTIRFFIKVEALKAPQAERDAFDKEVGGRQLDKSQVGDVKRSDLPGIEALGREGKKDGQVLMIKNNDVVEAYQWQAATSTWQQIGQVVDAIGSGRKQLYEGKEYDYVFDVDVSEGMPPLKLPYNASENPWMAAQRFLGKHELPMTYADQVVQFIEKNTAGVQLGTGNEPSTSYVDPYTGSSRYTGSSSTSGSSTGGGDPFTGGSAYSTTPSTATTKKSKGILPVTTYLSFKQMNPSAAKTKLSQLNEELKKSRPELVFTEADQRNLNEVFALLSLPSVALPDPQASDPGERYVPKAYVELMMRWPEDLRFPLIDIARCLAAVSPIFGHIPPSTFLTACAWSDPWQSVKSRETNTLLSLRGIANMFNTANGRASLVKDAEEILGKLRERKWEEVGNRKLPLATIALNYSILSLSSSIPTEPLISLISYILLSESEDSEVLYRSGVALGNVLTSSVSQHIRDQLAGALGSLDEKAKIKGEKRLVDLVEEVKSL